MSVGTSQSRRTPTALLSPGAERWVRQQVYQTILYRIFHPQRSHVLLTVPTELQRRLVLTSLVLGGMSLLAAFFPICGLPIAVTGLLAGLYGRHTTALRTLSTWAVLLSLVGLVLTLVNVVIAINIYFSTYFWL